MKSNNQKFYNKKTEQCCCPCGGSSKQIAISAVAIVLIAVSAVYANSWKQTKDEKVSLGLSSPNFPYRDYTQEELDKMYPQIKNADIPARTTPEQTYAKFRQALKDNNLEMAIEQLDKESTKRYEENSSDLKEAYQQNRFGEIYEKYPEEILKENMYESIAQYYFNYKENNEDRVHFIDFTKNSDGDWKMDSM